ncbi:MAG: putative bifunctional diguanylate cyclase/phosphodiesterase [Henriciella sp.]
MTFSLLRYRTLMSSFVRSIYHFADRLADLPADVSSTTRARTRALVVWTVFSVPLGVSLILASQDLTLTSPTSIGLIIGCLGMALAIRHMRVTQNLDQASLIFVLSAVFGLGAAAWVVSSPNLVPLIFLAVTPVYFGLIADWKQCLKYTLVLTGFYCGLAGWIGYKGVATPDTIMSIFACALAAIGGGLSTTAYAYTTARASRKLLKQKDEIVSLAFRDSLTGIYNRRAFNDHISNRCSPDRDHTIAVVDLDSFKAVNDQFGHEIGDEVLSELAKRLTDVTPEGAKSYRVGGDEFALILHEMDTTPSDFAQQVCEHATGMYQTSVGRLRVRVSVGIAQASAGQNDLKRLYYQADTALFEAKKRMGSDWAEYTPELGEHKRRRTRLSELLKTSIDDASIDVVFQPQLQLKPQSVIGYEALARWTTEEYGHISPSEFVAIADEAGLINRLDRCVFLKAIKLAEAWLRDDQKLAVNVSGKTLLSPGFLTFVCEGIERSSLSYQQIQIEITETEIIESQDAAKEICNQLRQVGISIALDDFGTGYSSLSYLSTLPINTLKIDKSFVQASHQGSNLKIIKSIVGLAKSLGIELLIEGIEEIHHLRIIQRLGCNLVQGYYFSRPIPPEACVEFERQHAGVEPGMPDMQFHVV